MHNSGYPHCDIYYSLSYHLSDKTMYRQVKHVDNALDLSDEEMAVFDTDIDSSNEKEEPVGRAQQKRKKNVVMTSSDEDDDEDEFEHKTARAADKKMRAKATTKMSNRSKKPAQKKSKVAAAPADDDDDEDMHEANDAEEGVKEEESAPTPHPTTVSRSGRVRRTVVRDNMVSEFPSDVSSSEDDDLKRKPAARKGWGAPGDKSSGRGKKRAPPSDDESSEESEVSSVASESSEDFSDDFEEEESEDDEMDFDEDEEIPKKKKARGAKKAKVATKKKAEEGGKKGMAESFNPLNAPPYFRKTLKEIQEQHECLDPCGTEATDDIIDRLVGDQVDKIGALLCRALKSGDCDLGSAKSPLKLGTACSGTDAPALALTLVQEQMALRNLLSVPGGKDGGCEEEKLLNVDHLFSCEVDAFKQSYLARNFDSTLYPDIGKLCDNPPLDVYGRPTKIPPHNFFVAGTSWYVVFVSIFLSPWLIFISHSIFIQFRNSLLAYSFHNHSHPRQPTSQQELFHASDQDAYRY